MEKVSFIIYYDEEYSLQECVYYIKNLHIPKGFEIEYVYLKEVESFEVIQERARKITDARYKVYLDQNVFLINPYFLYEILERFQNNPELGMIGVLGSKSGEAEDFGKILLWNEEQITEVNYTKEKQDERVDSINELLMATQYEMPYEEYHKVIPFQDCYWCIYDCRLDKGEEIEREYRYQLLHGEIFHDMESRRRIGILLNDGRLTLSQQIQRAEKQAFSKAIAGYYWEDYYFSNRKWKKLLPANGAISLKRDENKEMNIVMSFNHQYVQYAQVMLQSLYENNHLVNIKVHVLQCDLLWSDKEVLYQQARSFSQTIAFYDFERALLPEKINTTKEWSIEAYFRLFITEILPRDLDRLLYLDVDIIINKPIYDFYYMDMQEKEIVACRDFSLILKDGFEDSRKDFFSFFWKAENFVYINSGVMLIDMVKLRQKNYIEIYKKLLAECQEILFAPDQDIINLVHWQNIGLVDEYQYDFFNGCFVGVRVEDVKQHVSIIHYAGSKPWMPIDINQHAHKIWWEYAGRVEH